MSLTESVNVRDIFAANSPFGQEEVHALDEAICGSQVGDVRRELHHLQTRIDSEAQSSQSDLLRAGVASFLLGQHRKAEDYLLRVEPNAISAYYLAHVLASLGRHEEAEQQLDKAIQLGADPIDCTLRRAGSVRALGRLDEAEDLVRSVAKEGAGRAEYSFQMGCILSDRGDTYGAIEYFERAVDMDPHHSRALFWLAGENSLHGNDDEAIRLYEQSLSKPPHFLGALLNLGLLYEDRHNYAAAAYCFRRILEFEPNHPQATLYLKDIEATSEMYYDEESARNEMRLQQLLSRPVTDFELSVRSRNCLQSMDVYTLGDLTKVTEQDLLGGKNFGETSLQEIREMLTSFGLQIGQNLRKSQGAEPVIPPDSLSPQEQALLNKPVSDLNLSVRARKCMVRLGINTLGELIQRTPDELLGSRNFGVTSLNELRAKLAELDLKLRND